MPLARSPSARSGAPRVVVVGAGVMGRWHVQAARRLGAQVVAVVDPDEGAARALIARSGGASAHPSLHDALSACAADAVHVCTPLGTHGELTRVALAGGCHVLAEKPLAGSLDETEALLGLARERGLVLAPTHQFPFQPGFLRVSAGRAQLGELVRVAYRTSSAGGDGRPAAQRRAILREILPHPASLFHKFLGEAFDPSRLQVLRSTDDELELAGSAGAASLGVEISRRGRPTRNELHILGTTASAFVDLFHGYAIIEPGAVSRRSKALRPFRLGSGLLANAGGNLAYRAARREPAYPGLRELIRRFYSAAFAGGEPPVSEAETLAAARLVELAGP